MAVDISPLSASKKEHNPLNILNLFPFQMRFYALFGLTALCFTAPVNNVTHAAEPPSVEQINEDIQTFQRFFQARFPSLSKSDFTDGVNALPQYAHRVKSWQILSRAPAYTQDLEQAQALWKKPLYRGRSLMSCFDQMPTANFYPYFDGRSVRTIEADINSCLDKNKQSKLDPVGAQMAKLVAVYKSQSQGQPMSVSFSDKKMREVYARGKQFFWTKRGQMDFSCASCHVHNAGNRMRSDVLSPALGQTSAFPVYRAKWALNGQPWGTVHRQYASCNRQTGAAPFPPQSPQYIALEVYQAIMNTGIPLKSPSIRQ